jgi:hypothetical protein
VYITYTQEEKEINSTASSLCTGVFILLFLPLHLFGPYRGKISVEALCVEKYEMERENMDN